MSHFDLNHSLAGLRGLRKHRHVRIHEAAAVIGVADNSYVRYESGTRRMYYDQARALAKLLRCSMDDLGIWRDDRELWALFGPPNRPEDVPAGQTLPAPPPGAPETVPPPPGGVPAAAMSLPMSLEQQLAAWDAE